MSEDKGKEEDKFGLSPELEGYISLDEARVLALQHARDNREVYGRYAEVELVFEVVDAGETEDFYEVTLSYLPPGNFQAPGTERITINKAGPIELRQVLSQPAPANPLPSRACSITNQRRWSRWVFITDSAGAIGCRLSPASSKAIPAPWTLTCSSGASISPKTICPAIMSCWTAIW